MYSAALFHNIHGTVFEYLFLNVRQYKYDLMCGLHAYGKLHGDLSGEMRFCGGITLPDDSTIDSLECISVRINFIDTWLKALASNFACHCCEYQDKVKQLQSLHQPLKD